MAQAHEWKRYDQARALALWTRSFATLMSAGVSLMRCMDILLEASEDGAMSDLTREMKDRLDEGKTVSTILRDLRAGHRHYVAMVRAGEVGGVLDEVMHYLADWLDQDLEYMRLFRLYSLFHESLPPEQQQKLRNPTDTVGKLLAEVQPLVSVEVFCRALGYMLGSGVPLSLALECAAEAFEEGDREKLAAVQRAMQEGETAHRTLAETGLLPTMAIELWGVGEETGQLDRMMLAAAELLHGEIEAQMLSEFFTLPAPGSLIVEV